MRILCTTMKRSPHSPQLEKVYAKTKTQRSQKINNFLKIQKWGIWKDGHQALPRREVSTPSLLCKAMRSLNYHVQSTCPVPAMVSALMEPTLYSEVHLPRTNEVWASGPYLPWAPSKSPNCVQTLGSCGFIKFARVISFSGHQLRPLPPLLFSHCI